jgi:cytochrome c peroxidase
MAVSSRPAAPVLLIALACLLGPAGPAGAQIGGLGVSERELAGMKAEYRRPAPRAVENKALAELGRLLFWDPRLSASGKTSCATCHDPKIGWATLEATSRNDSGKQTSRKSQTLIGIGHMQARVGWDGRSESLEAQAKSSIATGSMSMRETATPVKVEVIIDRVRSAPEYDAMFRTALPGTAIDIDSIVKAVAAYERTMEPGIAPFDRWVEGDEQAISESAKRGFVLFNRDANCFACHSGWRFTDDKFHDIGTTTTDRGRGRELKDEEDMQFAFKTPTLRSVALHPPYMHNGSSATLHASVVHYEKGGIDRPSRSPLLQPITLTEQQRLDLVAFMETLSGSPEGDARPAVPASQ